jgi:hypothetical protein
MDSKKNGLDFENLYGRNTTDYNEGGSVQGLTKWKSVLTGTKIKGLRLRIKIRMRMG